MDVLIAADSASCDCRRPVRGVGRRLLVLAAELWHPSVPPAIRCAALVLAAVLVAPHLGEYDLVVVAPAFLVTANAVEPSPGFGRRRTRAILYVAHVAPLIGPLTSVTRVQLSGSLLFCRLVSLHWTDHRGRGGSLVPEQSPGEAAAPQREPAHGGDF
jgi:hypothetical protein